MLYFQDAGQGEPLVLLHPVGTSGEIWWQHTSRLSQQFRVITIDLLGHGRSPAPAETLSIEAMAESLHETLKTQGMLPAHLVGLSLGGMVAQTLAVRYPDAVKTMTLCDTLCEVNPAIAEALEARARTVEQAGMTGIISPTLQRWFTPEFSKAHADVVKVVETLLLETDPLSNAQTWRAIAGFDVSTRFKAASGIKTLVITGALDTGIPPDAGACLCQRFSAQLVTLENCSHMAPLEAPEKFMDILESFLLNCH